MCQSILIPVCTAKISAEILVCLMLLDLACWFIRILDIRGAAYEAAFHFYLDAGCPRCFVNSSFHLFFHILYFFVSTSKRPRRRGIISPTRKPVRLIVRFFGMGVFCWFWALEWVVSGRDGAAGDCVAMVQESWETCSNGAVLLLKMMCAPFVGRFYFLYDFVVVALSRRSSSAGGCSACFVPDILQFCSVIKS